MRGPPEFILVTDDNVEEVRQRAKREPLILNGIIHEAGSPVDVGCTVAFPWPDPITALGDLVRVEGATDVKRLTVTSADFLWVRVKQEGPLTAQTRSWVNKVHDQLADALENAGLDRGRLLLSYGDTIDISTISVVDLLARVGDGVEPDET